MVELLNHNNGDTIMNINLIIKIISTILILIGGLGIVIGIIILIGGY